MRLQYVIKVEIPTEIRDGFPKLMEKTRKHIVRQALRSALLPGRNNLKSQVMAIRQRSRQSSGATYRALVSKYAQHKSNPNAFYGIIGVNRHIMEYFDPTQKSPEFNRSTMRQVSFGIKNGFNQDGSTRYQRRWQRKEVRSYLKRRWGYSNPQHRKRRPSKYWHILNYGATGTDRRGRWKGKRTHKFAGYDIVQKALAATKAEAIAIFTKKMREHFNKAKAT